MFTLKSFTTPTLRKVVVRLPICHLPQTYTTTPKPLTILHHHFCNDNSKKKGTDFDQLIEACNLICYAKNFLQYLLQALKCQMLLVGGLCNS
jgi:hypothetical protein